MEAGVRRNQLSRRHSPGCSMNEDSEFVIGEATPSPPVRVRKRQNYDQIWEIIFDTPEDHWRPITFKNINLALRFTVSCKARKFQYEWNNEEPTVWVKG